MTWIRSLIAGIIQEALDGVSAGMNATGSECSLVSSAALGEEFVVFIFFRFFKRK